MSHMPRRWHRARPSIWGKSRALGVPEQVWGHISLVRVLIEPLGGVDTVEIAYRTDWDTEHTLGARFQGWALIELNGSVI